MDVLLNDDSSEAASMDSQDRRLSDDGRMTNDTEADDPEAVFTYDFEECSRKNHFRQGETRKYKSFFRSRESLEDSDDDDGNSEYSDLSVTSAWSIPSRAPSMGRFPTERRDSRGM